MKKNKNFSKLSGLTILLILLSLTACEYLIVYPRVVETKIISEEIITLWATINGILILIVGIMLYNSVTQKKDDSFLIPGAPGSGRAYHITNGKECVYIHLTKIDYPKSDLPINDTTEPVLYNGYTIFCIQEKIFWYAIHCDGKLYAMDIRDLARELHFPDPQEEMREIIGRQKYWLYDFFKKIEDSPFFFDIQNSIKYGNEVYVCNPSSHIEVLFEDGGIDNWNLAPGICEKMHIGDKILIDRHRISVPGFMHGVFSESTRRNFIVHEKRYFNSSNLCVVQITEKIYHENYIELHGKIVDKDDVFYSN